MDAATLCAMIRGKLRDGRLPNDHAPKVWGGHSNEERECDACGQRRHETPSGSCG